MKNGYDLVKNMTVEEFFNYFFNLVTSSEYNKKESKHSIYACIYQDPIDYKGLYKLLPYLDEDDISSLLKYDKDYKVSFLLSLVEFADEQDLTNQAIFLLKRHNLNYILPLLPYVDEEQIRTVYNQIDKKD